MPTVDEVKAAVKGKKTADAAAVAAEAEKLAADAATLAAEAAPPADPAPAQPPAAPPAKRRFTVRMVGTSPELPHTVEAADRVEAIEAWKKYHGIISTPHKIVVEDVP